MRSKDSTKEILRRFKARTSDPDEMQWEEEMEWEEKYGPKTMAKRTSKKTTKKTARKSPRKPAKKVARKTTARKTPRKKASRKAARKSTTYTFSGSQKKFAKELVKLKDEAIKELRQKVKKLEGGKRTATKKTAKKTAKKAGARRTGSTAGLKVVKVGPRFEVRRGSSMLGWATSRSKAHKVMAKKAKR